MLVNTKKMLEQANMSKYAIPSPDFISANMIRAYVQVAEELNRPAILAISESLSRDFSLEEAIVIGRYYAKKSSVPIAMHIDHGKSVEFIKNAIDLGFTSVMIDGSSDSFEENVRKTKEIVAYAHPRNVTVEAEIGHVGSGTNYEGESKDATVFTEVHDLVQFVQQTQVDSVAVSVGTAHGLYSGVPQINFERLKELKQAVSIPLVLHGGSSSGDENLRQCALIGISKINIFTDICRAAAKAVNQEASDNYRQMTKTAEEAMKDVLRHYYHVFQCD